MSPKQLVINVSCYHVVSSPRFLRLGYEIDVPLYSTTLGIPSAFLTFAKISGTSAGLAKSALM